jgi:hypothetical protein
MERTAYFTYAQFRIFIIITVDLRAASFPGLLPVSSRASRLSAGYSSSSLISQDRKNILQTLPKELPANGSICSFAGW